MAAKPAFIAPLLVLFLVSYNSIGQNSEHQSLEHAKARVRIVLKDRVGHDLGGGIVVSFKSRGNGKDFAKNFHVNDASEIPFGSYDLEVYKTGWFTTWRTVDVYAPEVWVLVGLEVGTELPEFPAPNRNIIGRIQHVDPSEEPIYIRMVGLYSSYLADAKLNSSGNSGTFQIAGRIPDGRFMLLIIGRSGLLCNQTNRGITRQSRRN